MNSHTEVDMKEGEGIRTAVDVLVLNSLRQVLLGLHRKAGKEVWGFPGGHQRTGEQLLETANRELCEELGEEHAVQVSSEIVAVRENCIPPWYIPHVTIVLLGTHTSGQIRRAEPERVLEWRWFDLDALPENMYSGISQILQRYSQNEVTVVSDWHEQG